MQNPFSLSALVGFLLMTVTGCAATCDEESHPVRNDETLFVDPELVHPVAISRKDRAEQILGWNSLCELDPASVAALLPADERPSPPLKAYLVQIKTVTNIFEHTPRGEFIGRKPWSQRVWIEYWAPISWGPEVTKDWPVIIFLPIKPEKVESCVIRDLDRHMSWGVSIVE